MPTPQHERLQAELTRRRLVREVRDSLRETGAERQLPYADFLDEHLKVEEQSKQSKRIRTGLDLATTPSRAPSSRSASRSSPRSTGAP